MFCANVTNPLPRDMTVFDPPSGYNIIAKVTCAVGGGGGGAPPPPHPPRNTVVHTDTAKDRQVGESRVS
jgi:hypothetical protein